MPTDLGDESQRLCRLALNGNLRELQLLANFANANSIYKNLTPLMSAAAGSHSNGLACAKHLLAVGANPRAVNQLGETVMHWAARKNNTNVMLLLHSHDASLIMRPTKRGDTPLHVAAALNCCEAVQLLIDIGAHVNERNCFGRTAADLAKNFKCWTSFLTITDAVGTDLMLVSEKEELMRSEMNAEWLCSLAYRCDSVKLAELLNWQNCNCRWRSRTPLMWAAAAPNNAGVKCVKLLLQLAADPTLLDFKGWTAAHHAAAVDNAEILRLLDGHVELKSDAGFTPLLLAVYRSSFDSVQTLMTDLKVDKNSTDNTGVTALEVAETLGNWRMAKLLTR